MTPSDEELAQWGQDDPYNSILQRKRFPILIAALRDSRERENDLSEALRLCMKDLQEYGVIFAPGDPPYDLLLDFDERSDNA